MATATKPDAQVVLRAPLVNDRVLFHPGTKDLEGSPTSPPMVTVADEGLAAVIVAVNEDGLVNLVIHDTDGSMFFRSAVSMEEQGPDHPDSWAEAIVR